ncbi:hypothetical protein [Brevibacillus fluminis]|uniref:hypothetical protein n=1 Tax=Brevibacillus fluminis TaxID=511487 RepID=UPI001606748A|nr:hypothetical protein [Brevibacillus fluminis]
MERLKGNLPYTIIILDHFKTRLGCCILTWCLRAKGESILSAGEVKSIQLI